MKKLQSEGFILVLGFYYNAIQKQERVEKVEKV